MREKQMVIKNPTGLHARPAAQLVKLCCKYKSNLQLATESAIIDCKSIFSVLCGGFKKGVTVTVRASGDDEEEALEAVIAFIDALEE